MEDPNSSALTQKKLQGGIGNGPKHGSVGGKGTTLTGNFHRKTAVNFTSQGNYPHPGNLKNFTTNGSLVSGSGAPHGSASPEIHAGLPQS